MGTAYFKQDVRPPNAVMARLRHSLFSALKVRSFESKSRRDLLSNVNRPFNDLASPQSGRTNHEGNLG
jgi:hypothetical protein